MLDEASHGELADSSLAPSRSSFLLDGRHAPVRSTTRVLITGASGLVGRIVGPALRDAGIDTIGFDRLPVRQGEPGIPTVIGSLTDPAAIRSACEGATHVIHLAANAAGSATLADELLEPNILGLHHVMEQAVDAGIRKIILASTIQTARHDASPAAPSLGQQRARNWYALTKIMAEHAGEMYHDRFGIDVIAVRIGWFLRSRHDHDAMVRQQAQDAFLAYDDATRFFLAAVTRPWSGFHVLYALSRQADPDRPTYDLSGSASLLGHQPMHRYPNGLAFSYRAVKSFRDPRVPSASR